MAAFGTKGVAIAWWDEPGPDYCEYCRHTFCVEVGYYCADCDQPICQHCVLSIREEHKVVCSHCIREGGE